MWELDPTQNLFHYNLFLKHTYVHCTLYIAFSYRDCVVVIWGSPPLWNSNIIASEHIETASYCNKAYIYNMILGSTVILSEIVFTYHFILGSTVYLNSRLHLPFYFGKQCILMRSCIHLPYYIGKLCITRSCLYVPFNFGEHCIFEKSTSFNILFWGAMFNNEKLSSFTIFFW